MPTLKRSPRVFAEDAAPTEIAAFLIERCHGNVQAARDAITRVNKARKKERGRPLHGDIYSLLIADAIQRHDKCSQGQALRQAAQRAATKEDPVANVLRRFYYQISKKRGYGTLALYAQDCRFQVTRSVTYEKDLGGRRRRYINFNLSQR